MRIFAEMMLSDVLELERRQVLEEIQKEPPNKILNVNESDYVLYLSEKSKIEPLVFNFEEVQASDREKMIRAEDHSRDFAVRAGCSYPRQVFTFHIPFTGW